jgi:hypothetical protein
MSTNSYALARAQPRPEMAAPDEVVPLRMKDERVDVSLDQRAVTDLVKRIRKLRWMGMEEEARQILTASLQLLSRNSVLYEPPDTD